MEYKNDSAIIWINTRDDQAKYLVFTSYLIYLILFTSCLLLFCYARYRENSTESKRQLSRNFS